MSVALVQQTAEPEGPDEQYLWPECESYWRVWEGLQTQWRSDMAGNMGLDYAGVRADLRAGLGLEGAELAEHWRCIKACELGTLQAWAERRERDKDKGGGINGRS